MFSMTAANLDFLKAYYSNTQDKVTSISEELQSLEDDQSTHINVHVLIDVFRNCDEAASISQQLIKQYEMLLEEKEQLEQSLNNYERQTELLIQQNQKLNSTIEVLQQRKNQSDSLFLQLQRKITYNGVQNSSQESDPLLLEEISRMEQIYQLKIKYYQRQLALREQTIQKLEKKLSTTKEQLKLQTTELQLAQLVLTDAWKNREQMTHRKNSALRQTYSPSLNQSCSDFKMTQNSGFQQANKKQSSLMQDLFQSELTYNEPQYFSNFNKSTETLPQIQEQIQKVNQQVVDLQLCSNFSSRSPYQSHKSRQIILSKFITKLTQSYGTQTQELSLIGRMNKWLSYRVITRRIKK